MNYRNNATATMEKISISGCNNMSILKGSHGEGITDSEGNIIIPCTQDFVERTCTDGYVFYGKEGKSGICFTEKKKVIPAVYDDILDTGRGHRIIFTLEGKKGYCTYDGKFFSTDELRNIPAEEFCNHDFIANYPQAI